MTSIRATQFFLVQSQSPRSEIVLQVLVPECAPLRRRVDVIRIFLYHLELKLFDLLLLRSIRCFSLPFLPLNFKSDLNQDFAIFVLSSGHDEVLEVRVKDFEAGLPKCECSKHCEDGEGEQRDPPASISGVLQEVHKRHAWQASKQLAKHSPH